MHTQMDNTCNKHEYDLSQKNMNMILLYQIKI